MSRTKNTYRNFSANFLKMILTVLLSFIVRTVFIQTLGKEYLGLNGLFANIFSILSLTELGIGTAISFNLYKPLADRDNKKILILMKFYKAAYRKISMLILICGLLIMPFLEYIIKDDVEFVNIYIIFLIYLLQSVASYSLFAYKSTLIKADQKEHKVVKVELFVDIGVSILQIISLVVIKNFIVYTFLLVFSNLLKNYLISRKVDTEYPFINDKTDEKLTKVELNEMFKDLGAVFLYKINTVILTATDNIVISTFLGLSIVGLYSNYILITNTIRKLIGTFYTAVKASIGNLHATTDSEHEYQIFNVINMITAILFGGGAIGVAVVTNSFITIWIGEEYLLTSIFPILLAIEFYLRGMQMFLAQFRTSMGLFRQAKYRPVASMLINLCLSLILVQFFDIIGVVMGTIISILTTSMWYDPIIIHKYGLYKSSKMYFLRNIFFLSVTFLAGIISYRGVSLINGNTIISLISKIGLTILITSITYFISFYKMKEMILLKTLIINALKKKFRL